MAAALLPVFVLLYYVFRRDAFPEPVRVVAMTFVLGCLTVVPLIGMVTIFGRSLSAFENPFLYASAGAFLEAAIPEEAFKFLVLYLYAFRHDAFDEPIDGIVYGVAASLGFAAVENVFYVADGGIAVAAARAITALPFHALNGAIMGFYLGLVHAFPWRREEMLAKALGVPILLHGLYDVPLLLMEREAMAARGAEDLAGPFWIVPWLLVFMLTILTARRLYKRLKRMQSRQAARREPAPGSRSTGGSDLM